MRLRDVVAIDAEEGGKIANLHCKDGETLRIEEISGGDLATFATVCGRPARIWRECGSLPARLAKRGQLIVAATSGAIAGGGTAWLLAFGDGPFVRAAVAALAVGAVHMAASISRATLPHFLIGRWLSGEARRDFVGWMTDLRWRGVRPDGPDDGRLPHSRLQDWAMRLAYGENPELGEREPEIIIPGKFRRE